MFYCQFEKLQKLKKRNVEIDRLTDCHENRCHELRVFVRCGFAFARCNLRVDFAQQPFKLCEAKFLNYILKTLFMMSFLATTNLQKI